MAAEWFCEISGEQIGPLSSQQLRAMVEQGRLTSQHRVRQGNEGPWVPASRVKGLFPSELPQPEPSAGNPPAPSKAVKPIEASAAQPPAEVPEARPLRPNHVRRAKASSVPPPPPPAASEPSTAVVPEHGEFSIVTDSDTMWERVAGRSVPGRLIPKRYFLIGGLLAVLVIGLTVTAVVVFLGDRPKANTAEAEPGSEVASAGPDDNDIEWVNASESAIACGDVQVRILAAERGYPRFGGRFRDPSSRRECLLLTIQLQNLGTTRKVEYRGWRTTSSMIRRIQLTDNVSNSYRLKNIGRETVEGQTDSASIYPGESINDMLVFERPVDTAEYLYLELPSAAFGQTAPLYFMIPKELIAIAAEEPGLPDTELPDTELPEVGLPEPDFDGERPPRPFGDPPDLPLGAGAIERGIEELAREERERAETSTGPAEGPGDEPEELDSEDPGQNDEKKEKDVFADEDERDSF